MVQLSSRLAPTFSRRLGMEAALPARPPRQSRFRGLPAPRDRHSRVRSYIPYRGWGRGWSPGLSGAMVSGHSTFGCLFCVWSHLLPSISGPGGEVVPRILQAAWGSPSPIQVIGHIIRRLAHLESSVGSRSDWSHTSMGSSPRWSGGNPANGAVRLRTARLAKRETQPRGTSQSLFCPAVVE